jgi:acyl transferase domain-containing protein/acyl carrier protein
MSDLSQRLAELSPEKRALLGQRLAGEKGLPEPIAIIGMGCRFPGAASPQEYWQLLRLGRDAVTEVPADRWNAGSLYDPDPAAPGKMNTRWGGFLEQVDRFDPLFFGISPREAMQMDPQQRLILEVAWESLEDAGQVPERLVGTPTGVFIGIMTSDYAQTRLGDLSVIDAYTGTGNAYCLTANRISYQLGFSGPSLAVDTACSSSLVAVHLACQSLRAGECTLALAGGVNVILWPGNTIYFAKAGLMAPDGRCKTFDARADGIVRGEGAGILVLKPLSKALADGDPVHAVIRGSAVNQDGRSNGLTAPSRQAQEAVLREAYRRAGVSPGRVQYVEAHGTGTALGDPIEAKALGAVLSEDRPPGSPCLVGSAKTNMGHLEAAAGIAGLMKVVLALRHREVPPSLHFVEANPAISFDSLRLRVTTALTPWPEGAGPALAGVSSFGFGGTNAHVVVEEAPVQTASQRGTEGPWILPLSAHNEPALRARAAACEELLADPAAPLDDIAHTAGARRLHHEWRLAVVGGSRSELASGLAAFLAGREAPGLAVGRSAPAESPRLAFVFSGQGPQWWGMGRQLLDSEPVFRAVIERCDQLLRRHASWSLLAELTAPEASFRLDRTDFAQPCLFALQVALATLWRSWGIRPDAVVGHSVGEVAAACVAGLLRLEDAVRVSCERGRLMQEAAGRGKMAEVELAAADAERLLEPYGERLSVAAVNAPGSTVLSGEPAALEEVLATLAGRGVLCRVLPVEYAFHSSSMAPVENELARALAELDPHPPEVPFYSTVTGGLLDGERADGDYWGRNVGRQVRFAPAIGRMLDAGRHTFLEIGPHPVLGTALSRCLDARGESGAVLASLRRRSAERAAMLDTLGTLYALGHQVDWSRVQRGRCVPLPPYPWQRERFWLESRGPAFTPPNAEGRHPLLAREVRLSQPEGALVWEVDLDLRTFPFLGDHRLVGAVVLPGAVYLEMALAGAERCFGPGPCGLSGVELERALVLPADEARRLQLVFLPTAAGASFQISSSAPDAGLQGGWTLHARGEVLRRLPATPEPGPLAEIVARCQEVRSADDLYRGLGDRGNHYGPAFRGVEQLRLGDGEALGRIGLPTAAGAGGAGGAGDYRLHPAALDACLQILAAPLGILSGGPERPVAIAGFEEVRLHGRLLTAVWSHARIAPGAGRGEVRVFDEAGGIVAELLGVRTVAVGRGQLAAPAEGPGDWLYELDWQPKPQSPGSVGGGTWLVLGEMAGPGERLVTELERRGAVCVLDPSGPEQLERRLAEARAAGARLHGVVCLWALGAAGEEPWIEQETVCGGALRLLQALARQTWSGQPPRLWLVTRGAQQVAAGEPVAVAQAPLWGLGRVIAREHPELWGGLVDLSPVESPQDGTALAGELSAADGEDQVAFRDGRRSVARLVPWRRGMGTRSAPELSDAASYLITGGLGELGLSVARWMVARGARHLVLAGRREPSEAARRRLAELEGLGARVTVARADVSRREEVRGLVSSLARQTAPLRGVVHAAGVLDDGVLAQQSWQRFSRVLAPKLAGGWNLHRETADLELDFFVLFSSAASLLGPAGQGNYAAANAFLDALAYHRRAQGLPGLSVSWGSWSGGGMAAGVGERARDRWREMGLGEIGTEQGLELLEKLLGEDRPLAAVLPMDWRRWRQSLEGEAPPLFHELVAGLGPEPRLPPGQSARPPRPAGESSGLRQALAAAFPSVRREIVVRHVAEQASRVLRLATAQIEPKRGLFDLGMDSIMALELRRRLQTDLETTLPSTLVFDHPSIGALADYLLREVLGEGRPVVVAESVVAEARQAQRREDLEALSAEELAELLDKRLASLKERKLR